MSTSSLLVAAPATAAETVDQQTTTNEHYSYSVGLGLASVAQTFTVGRTGKLTRVDLSVFAGGTPAQPITVELRPLAAGATPGTTTLASASRLDVPATHPTFVGFTFAQPVDVTVGQRYALVVSSAEMGPTYQVSTTSDPYPSGAGYVSVSGGPWTPALLDEDFIFRTYVTTPDAPQTVPTPDTTITKAPAKRVHKRLVKFKFRSDLAGATFECSVDGKRFKSCTSPKRKRTGAGAHTFEVRAVLDGRVDQTPATVSWRTILHR